MQPCVSPHKESEHPPLAWSKGYSNNWANIGQIRYLTRQRIKEVATEEQGKRIETTGHLTKKGRNRNLNVIRDLRDPPSLKPANPISFAGAVAGPSGLQPQSIPIIGLQSPLKGTRREKTVVPRGTRIETTDQEGKKPKPKDKASGGCRWKRTLLHLCTIKKERGKQTETTYT